MSLARNTIFALTMAIEQDLRRLLVSALERNPLTPNEADLALKRSIADDAKTDPDAWRDLIEYTDLGPLLDACDRHSEAVSSFIGADRSRVSQITKLVRPLVPIRNRVCHARPLEPEDLVVAVDTAERLDSHEVPVSFLELGEVRVELATAKTYPLTLDIPSYWRIGEETIDHNLPPPEWDDTGFIGRSKDRENLLKLMLGPHPVLTVTGEGGAGKTALAVRCLYDLIDRPSELDAIVWTSLKTARLTTSGMRAIVGAMTTEIEILTSIAGRFGSSDSADRAQLYDTVLEIMSEFRVLLIIDNMETLDRDALRPLLMSIPRTSKILTTSRIGIGEFEVRYPLQPMEVTDAVHLLRRTARLFNTDDLYKRPENELAEIAQQLFFSPLAIRWFVQSYSEGRSVRDLLDRRRNLDDLLRFCFQNLYETLTEDQTRILRILVALGKPLSEVQMSLLTGTRAVEDIRNSLHYLYSSNLLLRARDAWLNSETPLWTVSEFARQYIVARDKQVSTERLRVHSQFKALIATRDASKTAASGSPFSAWVIHASSTDEATVVRSLKEAMVATKKGEHATALEHVRTACALLPDFYEVWRVSAHVRDSAGDVIGASEDYEKALDLADSKSAPLLVFYANFLAKQSQFDEAVALLNGPASQPDAPLELVAMYGWMQSLSGRVKDAVETFGSIHAELFELGGRARSHYVTQFAETLRRAGEVDRARNLPREAIQHVFRALAVIDQAAAGGMLDERMVKVAHECVDQACRIVAGTCNSSDWKQFVSLADSLAMRMPILGELTAGAAAVGGRCGVIAADPAFNRLFGGYLTKIAGASEAKIAGLVSPIQPGKDYAFIRSDDGRDFFFHRGHFSSPLSWAELRDIVPVRVSFSPSVSSQDGKAPRATNVILEQRREH